jgi:hypothetical protein
MNIYAAIFLIPFSVVLYTMTGGLKVSGDVALLGGNITSATSG